MAFKPGVFIAQGTLLTCLQHWELQHRFVRGSIRSLRNFIPCRALKSTRDIDIVDHRVGAKHIGPMEAARESRKACCIAHLQRGRDVDGVCRCARRVWAALALGAFRSAWCVRDSSRWMSTSNSLSSNLFTCGAARSMRLGAGPHFIAALSYPAALQTQPAHLFTEAKHRHKEHHPNRDYPTASQHLNLPS